LQKYIEHNCRTTAKEKSRRNADAFSRAHEAAALIFRAANVFKFNSKMPDQVMII